MYSRRMWQNPSISKPLEPAAPPESGYKPIGNHGLKGTLFTRLCSLNKQSEALNYIAPDSLSSYQQREMRIPKPLQLFAD